MGYWKKYFIDNTHYTGTDYDVSIKQASWRNSRLDGIARVELVHDGYLIAIEGPGDYWQSDTYTSTFMDPNKPKLSHRRIERKIDIATDKFIYVLEDTDKYMISFNKSGTGKIYPINPEWHDKWLVLEYELRYERATRYIWKCKI